MVLGPMRISDWTGMDCFGNTSFRESTLWNKINTSVVSIMSRGLRVTPLGNLRNSSQGTQNTSRNLKREGHSLVSGKSLGLDGWSGTPDPG